METAWEHFGRGVPPVPPHQTHITQLTFSVVFIPSWGKKLIVVKNGKISQTQEPLKKENLRQDQLEKGFNRKLNVHLT